MYNNLIREKEYIMMIGSSSKQALHLSISNGYQSTNDSDKTPKCKKENITEKNTSTNNKVNNPLKKNDPLKDLIEQKQKITDTRQKYLNDAFSKNESSESIKSKLAEYDKQISEIDKQINELKLAEQKKHVGTDDKDKKNDKVKDNSNNTATNGNPNPDNSTEMIDKLVNLSNNISQAKILSAEKVSESGEIKVLDWEIKRDGIKNPVGNARKEKHITKLEDNIENIEKTIGDKLNPKTSNDNSNNVVNRNEQSENSKEEKSTNNSNESIRDSKLLQTIKKYKDNIDDETQTTGQKINSEA